MVVAGVDNGGSVLARTTFKRFYFRLYSCCHNLRALATLFTLAALSFLLYSLLLLRVFLLLLTSNKTYKSLMTKWPTLIILATTQLWIRCLL